MNKILSVLKQVETQGSFCARLTVPTQNLHIEVDDVKVNLPLSQRKVTFTSKQSKGIKKKGGNAGASCVQASNVLFPGNTRTTAL